MSATNKIKNKIKIKRTPIALSIFALTIIACQVVAGIERVQKVSPTIGAGGDGSPLGDGSSGGLDGPSPDDPCAHFAPPPIPAADDDPATKLPPFWLAVRTISVTKPDGFDLDHVCTCDPRPATFRGGASTCKPVGTNSPCDEDGGIDNTGASLFGSFANTGVDVDQSITDDISEGRKTLLLQISGWNGKANDLEVSVGILVSTGLSNTTGCGQDGKPHWCSHDKWDYPEGKTAVIAGTVFPIYKADAYVSNNQLVFTKGGSVTMFFGTATLTFGSPIMAGTLEPAGSSWKLSGNLSGRIPITELLGAIGQFKAPPQPGIPPGSFICESDTALKFVKGLLCPAVDITHGSVFDNQEAACDSISSTVTFTAEAAELGSEVPPLVEDNPCSPTNPANAQKYVCP